jgi:hypothetical protein
VQTEPFLPSQFFTLYTSRVGVADVPDFNPPFNSPEGLIFPGEQGFLTSISFRFDTDGVAQEINETFTITFSGLVEGTDVAIGATIIPEFTGTIVDEDGK